MSNEYCQIRHCTYCRAVGARSGVKLQAGRDERLGPGENYLTVIVEGKAIVRSTRGISHTLLQLWRKEPAMMVPDSYGYQPATRSVDLSDL